jgi:hypothetical protein
MYRSSARRDMLSASVRQGAPAYSAVLAYLFLAKVRYDTVCEPLASVILTSFGCSVKQCVVPCAAAGAIGQPLTLVLQCASYVLA